MTTDLGQDRKAVVLVRALPGELGLEAGLKTYGGKGPHVVVLGDRSQPICPSGNFTAAFATVAITCVNRRGLGSLGPQL